MQVNIICVGKLKEKFYRDACAEYEKRLSRYHKLKIIELNDEKPVDDSPEDIRKVLQKEGDKILPHLQRGYSIAMCISAPMPDSVKLAAQMRSYETLGTAVNFVIGGSWGLDERVIAACKGRLSLSPLTLPHNLARLVLLEQIYRSARINAGESYHK